MNFNIDKDKKLYLGFEGEHNSRYVTFTGYKMKSEQNVLLFNIKIKKTTISIPLVDYSFPVTQDICMVSGDFKGSLEERDTTGNYVKKTHIFDVRIDASLTATSEQEVTSPDADLWCQQVQSLYNDIYNAYQNGELKGEKGDPFKFEDFTQEQLNTLKGTDGNSLVYYGQRSWNDTDFTNKTNVGYYSNWENQLNKNIKKGDILCIFVKNTTSGNYATIFILSDSSGTGAIQGTVVSVVRDGEKGSEGKKGTDGKNGSDANVTKQNVEAALGYTPLKATDLTDYAKKTEIPTTYTKTELDNKLGSQYTQIVNLSTNKVDKVNGKGLSSNDYTNEDKEKLDNKLDKLALLDAGIKSITWSTVRSEISVTTVEDSYKSQRPSGTNTRYWGEFEGCPYFKNRQLYRVTFNGVVYNNLVCDYGILIDDGSAGKHSNSTNDDVGGSWQLIGNKNLYDSRYESTGEPFCIMYIEHGGMNTDSSYYYGYQIGHGILLTSSAGVNTFKIERANISQEDLPKSLFNNFGFGDKTYQNINNSTYPRTSLGQGNIVGRGSFAIGESNISTAQFALAEGFSTTASGGSSHAEGMGTTASGHMAHAEGAYNTASGNMAHAEGIDNIASGAYSHSEGVSTTTSGGASHAEGQGTQALANMSHAEGNFTIANGRAQHVQGQYNIKDESDTESAYGNGARKYIHIVGNGTSDTARSNAHTLDWQGNAWFQGDVYVGGTSQTNGVKLLRSDEQITDTHINSLIDAKIGSLETLANSINELVGGES